jgi:hypothetical protein
MAANTAAQGIWRFHESPGRVEITVDGNPVATYVYQDKELPRPYFAQVHAPGSTPVTRHHPPLPGEDTDHGTPGKFFHPGIWLAFSNVNGNDYWRLKAHVDHLDFSESPVDSNKCATFTVHNAYRDQQDPKKTVFEEKCRYTFALLPNACLIGWDSVLYSNQKLEFGDEEEMGLGTRAAMPLAVKHGGRMLNSRGQENEAGIWGQVAEWCDTSGKISGNPFGILLLPDSSAERPYRFHARDTGFMTANPFGSKAFKQPQQKNVTLAPGELLRLRFCIVLHTGDDSPQKLQATADAAHRLLASQPRPAPH